MAACQRIRRHFAEIVRVRRVVAERIIRQLELTTEVPHPVRPASILLETAGPDLAAVVEQALANVLPDRMRTEKLHGVEALDLDGPPAAPAFHPEKFAGDLRQPHLLEGQPWPSGGARVLEKRLPVILGVKLRPEADRRTRGSAAGQMPFPSVLRSAFARMRGGRS
jgi:hypothetical protein